MPKSAKIDFPSKYRDLKKTHFEILKAAESILGTYGVNGLELKKIANLLDVSPSLIHHYYRNSEELIFDTVLFSYNQIVTKVVSEFGNSKDPELAARIWISTMMKWEIQFPGIGIILEFPRQVLRTGGKSAVNADALLKKFVKEMAEIGANNVAFMASAVRALQKKKDFKQLSIAKVASLIATDAQFAMYTSVLGFATIGGGLWIAGRRPDDKKNPFWKALGFNPEKQTQTTIDRFLKLIKES